MSHTLTSPGCSASSVTICTRVGSARARRSTAISVASRSLSEACVGGGQQGTSPPTLPTRRVRGFTWIVPSDGLIAFLLTSSITETLIHVNISERRKAGGDCWPLSLSRCATRGKSRFMRRSTSVSPCGCQAPGFSLNLDSPLATCCNCAGRVVYTYRNTCEWRIRWPLNNRSSICRIKHGSVAGAK